MASISNQLNSSSFPPSSSSFPLLLSSAPSSTPQWKYDVFLSFRGEDTRKNFTDHLYASLIRNGISVFRDDNNLERGETIRPELFKAIKESMISIIIFSRTYASSMWCLDELAKIVKCKNKLGQKVVPVFYHVDPSDVRKQKGSFEEDFSKHEEAFRDNPKKVQRWKAAMTEAADLSGFHLGDRHEAEFIQDIVKDISSKLNPTKFCAFEDLFWKNALEDLVGIYSRLEKLMNLHISIGLDNVGMIGICGMGGIGKTTIARGFYKRMSCQFEGSSFLTDVREVSERGDIVHLQKQLLSEILMARDIDIWNAYNGIDRIRRRLCSKRVLVIIDDVNRLDQLEKLAGKHDWFGPGSIIIITSRDKSLLVKHGVNEIYGVEELEHDEAVRLFSMKAFNDDHLPEDFVEISRHFVNYAKGLPLALKVLGSFLFDKTVHEWKSALERLKENPEKEIFDVLKLSFDGLKESEKEIFLDVACFFKGKQKDHVMGILNSCGFRAEIGIRVLIDKSLITFSYDRLWMHDLLQDLGCKIVEQESLREPGERSRLWLYSEVYHVLTKNTGTENVGAMVLDLPKLKGAQLSSKAFSKLSKLRLLILRNVHISYSLEYLSNELRFLEWYGYPFKCMPSSFQPDKLVELNLCSSRIEQLWKGIKPLNKLKIIKLSHSQKLISGPDFRIVPNLEKLILEGCTKLSEVDQSIGVLEKLTLLNLKDCKNLERLPNSICCLKSLKTFNISGCSKLENIPEKLGNVECLEEIDVSGTAIRQPPSSIFHLKNLKALSFRGCKGPSTKAWRLLSPSWLMKRRSLDPMPLMLPSLLGLCSLTRLDLSDCNLWEAALPNDINCLSSLIDLNLSSNNFVSLPASISRLSNLKYLSLDNCERLQSLPEFPSNIEYVQAEACSSLKALPDTFAWSFNGFRCFQLIENQGYNSVAFARMKRCLQVMYTDPSILRKTFGFDIVLPGGEIPEWFSHRSDGCSISIKRPPLLHDSKNNKLMGFALCSVFVVHDHSPVLHDVGPNVPFSHYLSCDLKIVVEANTYITFCRSVGFYFQERLGNIVSDHIWLLYISNNWTHFDTSWQDCSNIEFSFKSGRDGGVVEVKKCGVRPVYEYDVEEFSQTTNDKCTSSFFEKFNDLHQDFDKSAMNGTMIKHIQDDCDMAEPSGSDSCVEEPQSKRLKINS